jgi:chemotaxis protein MotB
VPLTWDLIKCFFDTGKAILRKEAKLLLDRLIPILKTYTDYLIRVEGHADPRPIRGRLKKIYRDNWVLSRARAESVRKYLVKIGHIPEQRILLKWYGATKPIAPNTTPEGMQKNRRVEITLIPNKPK